MTDSLASKAAINLLQIKAIKLNPHNPFTWASGMKSPIYCDNRKVLSYIHTRRFIKEALVQCSQEFKPFTMVAGVATAGIAHGVLLADALDLPFVYVRSKAKGHGMQNLIEGELRGNERILVVEDLISTGGSCLKAVDALEGRGCEVSGVLAIFSYGFQKAIDAFEEYECKFGTVTNYEVLLQEALNCNYINQADFETLKAWRKDPENWK